MMNGAIGFPARCLATVLLTGSDFPGNGQRVRLPCCSMCRTDSRHALCGSGKIIRSSESLTSR